MKSICAISLCLSIFGFVCWQLGFRVNLTPSLPMGLYRLSGGPLHRGQIVAFCLDDPEFVQLARERGYLAAGSCPSGLRPLLKVINGLPGDSVQQCGDIIVVNNHVLEHTKILGRDSQGRAIPSSHLPPGAIPAGKVLLLSQHHDGSFDSRYFGLVPIVSLRPVEPVITF